MDWRPMAAAVLACLTASSLLAAQEPVDWNKARELRQRVMRGEKLAPEDQAYYERALALRRNGRGPGQAPAPQAPWSGHLAPLTELGSGKYKGEDGGLYGGGRNDPPPTHAEAARKEAAKIRPLDDAGRPSKTGKIGLLSVGMSNTTMEFSRFKVEAVRDAAKSGSVAIVDGAQGGQTATIWANPAARVWEQVDSRLKRAGLTPQQVQVVWIKQAEAGPSRLGEFPAHAQVLKDHLVTVLNLLKSKFPNLRIAYLSSRIYAGYATTPLNPEPYAYESAFSVRWLVQDQIRGKPELNCDPGRGEVKAPLLLWGPYLWADGMMARKSDGLVWERKDLAERDGTHPSDPSGREKVAQMLLKFFKTDPTARVWFTAGEPAGAAGRAATN
jgi:hypothetical protein